MPSGTVNQPGSAGHPPPAENSPPPGVICPRCGSGRLDPARPGNGVVECSACGHRAAAQFVGEQLWLERQAAALHARLGWVRERVVAGDPVGGPPDVLPAAAVRRSTLTVQTVLLSGGALLLVLAGVVFAAVAWDRLGAAGQVVVMALAVAILSTVAHLIRRSYRNTAEALATIAAGVATVALLSAPHLGLGADWMRDRPAGWAAIALAAVAVLGAVLAGLSRLISWHVTVIVAVVTGAWCAVLEAGGGSSITPVGSTGLALAATLLVLGRPGRHSGFRHEAPWIGAGLGLLAVVSGLAAYAHLDRPVPWATAWLFIGLCAASVVVPWPVGGLRVAPVGRTADAVATVVLGFAAGQVVPLGTASWTAARWLPVCVLAVVGAVLFIVALLPAVWASGGTRSRWAVSARGVPWLGVGGLIAAVITWLATLPVLAAAGDVDGVGGVGGLSAAQVSVFFGIVAVAILGAALLPGRVALAWVAAPVGTVALWVMLADVEVRTLEAYSGSSAALLMAAGLLHYRVRRTLGSLAVAGPALFMAAAPSAVLAAVQASDGDDLLRALAVIVGGAGLAVAGAALRLRAPLSVGAAAATVAGLGQVAALTGMVPRWVALAAAGVLLVAAGFFAERLAKAGRTAWQATSRMR